MMKLSATSRSYLKGCHIICTCAWVGAGVCMFLLNFVARPNNSHDLYVVMAALKLIDDWVIIPAAAGSLLTGLLLSWLTPWGFFKWHWVTVKWVLTIIMTLFGMFYLSPWLHEMADITVANPHGVLQDETFLTNRWLLSLSGGPMFLSMFFLVFLSVIKPWSGRNRRRTLSRPAPLGEAPEQRPNALGERRRSLGQAVDLSEALPPCRQQGCEQIQLGGDHRRIP
ncbi:DUF2269 family protein [Chloroflexales bacterium ZM16-3]|nr:DUF2269 family protein [Chloroflexales bacterium ZM16-3]